MPVKSKVKRVANGSMLARGSSPTLVSERLGKPDMQGTSEALSLITSQAVYQYKQARFQPIAYLTPEVLTQQLSQWNTGTMRSFSMTMDALENRDCLTKSVTSKLKMTISRRDYQIIHVDRADESEAAAHAQALDYFYSNLQTTNAIDRNQQGGFHTLVHQMMDAALKRYAIHEIVWQPIGTEQLTGKFVFVPLWFFENRTGALRFCAEYAWDGQPLKEGQWMVTVGEGIMEAISVSWMYKTIALRDWITYSEKDGMPVPIGKTQHRNGSQGWNDLQDALTNYGPNSAIIVGIGDEIDKIDFGSTGALPYPPLVEYMDKTIAALARGADLSTLSAGGASRASGQGASLQSEEAEMIEQHYGQVINETLNQQVDKKVLQWHFGPDVVPAAYIKLVIPVNKDVVNELAIDTFLLSAGVELGKGDVLERYSRSQAEAGEPILSAPMQPVTPVASGLEGKPLNENLPGSRVGDAQINSNSSRSDSVLESANVMPHSQHLLSLAMRRLAKETSVTLKPLRDKLELISGMANEAQFKQALIGLRDELPVLLREINKSPENAHVLRDIISTMAINGLTASKQKVRQKSTPIPNEKIEDVKTELRSQGQLKELANLVSTLSKKLDGVTERKKVFKIIRNEHGRMSKLEEC